MPARARTAGRWIALLALLAVISLQGSAPAGARAQEAVLLQRSAGPLTFHSLPEHAALAGKLAESGPQDLARIASALGLPAPAHVDVYVLPRRSSVDPSAWGMPLGPEWAAGLALSGRPVVVLRTAEDLGPYGNEARTVLTHELVHATCSQALGRRYSELPAWMREGLASYLSFDWGLGEGASAARHVLMGEYLPLADLADGFPADRDRAHLAYLESFAFVAWLVKWGGEDRLRALMTSVAGGQPFALAFRQTYGASPSELERRWQRRFFWRHRWLPIVTSSSTLWLGMTALFVFVAVRRRREAARVLERWASEEPGGDPGAAAGDGPGADGGVDDGSGVDGDVERPRGGAEPA